MRLALDPRTRRLLRRLPRGTLYTALELVLLSLLALQSARLVWTLVTPVGPVGEWRISDPKGWGGGGATSLLGSFDPFFRLSATPGAVMVTSLALKLYGVREDRASGRGSAIIATPDGQQRSFVVGDEIVPGVTLAAVSFDGVTISRGGTQEQLFLDQSTPATIAAPAAAATSYPAPSLAAAAPSPVAVAPPPAIAGDDQFSPRLDGGAVRGIAVQPQGSGAAFRAAGLQPGDVVTAIGGQRITSLEQAREAARRFTASGGAPIEIERGGQTVTLQVRNGE